MSNHETAVFGGGCFWCLEAVFQRLEGVDSVISGYAGGHVINPSYRQICNGDTGHAEVVKIAFDPGVITYEDLLEWFWRCHDPTTLNRQGGDVGPQYRSIILWLDEGQRRSAEASRQAAQAHFQNPIVTEIEALTTFYSGEDYHQDYFNQNARAPYCAFVIRPKLEKLGLN